MLEWKDAGGTVLRVIESEEQEKVLVQIERNSQAWIFFFDTPGQFGDFVASMIEVAKQVYKLDFSQILSGTLNIASDTPQVEQDLGTIQIVIDGKKEVETLQAICELARRHFDLQKRAIAADEFVIDEFNVAQTNRIVNMIAAICESEG